MVLDRVRVRAWKKAMESPCPHYKHSAIIHKNSKFLTGAYNLYKKTCPGGSGFYSTCHAEVRAIRQALNMGYNLSNCSIYVMRVNRSGIVRLSKPCKDCQKLIDKYGMRCNWSE